VRRSIFTSKDAGLQLRCCNQPWYNKQQQLHMVFCAFFLLHLRVPHCRSACRDRAEGQTAPSVDALVTGAPWTPLTITSIAEEIKKLAKTFFFLDALLFAMLCHSCHDSELGCCRIAKPRPARGAIAYLGKLYILEPIGRFFHAWMLGTNAPIPDAWATHPTRRVVSCQAPHVTGQSQYNNSMQAEST
jgi:hypothetical protein